MFKQFFQEYFRFTKRERRGTLWLLVILFISIIIKLFVSNLKPKSNLDFSMIQTKLDSLEKLKKDKKQNPVFTNIKDTILAAPDKYLHSKTPTYNTKYEKGSISVITPKKIELNASDSVTMVDSANIRTYLAHNIIKYRSLLGGFYTINQLQEVYGVKESSLSYLLKVCYVDSSQITKLNVNESSFKELLRHPYLEYETVKKVVNARKENTLTPKSLQDLLGQELYIKIAPYLEYYELN